MQSYLLQLPGDFSDHVGLPFPRYTPGLAKLEHGITSGTFNLLGAVNRKSNVSAKRKPDEPFVFFELDQYKVLEDLPFRNSDVDGVYAYTAFAKYDHPEPSLAETQVRSLNLAATWMTSEFGMYIGQTEIFTEEQVIAGTDGTKSPGFPWNRAYQTCDDFYEGCHRDEIRKLWDRSAQGVQMVIWNSFLKEELRAVQKVLSGDTRQINGCPVDFKICLNRYCLDFNQRFYDSHLKTPSAVGIDPFHGGWNTLYKKLCAHPSGYCADVKRWDSHFPRVIFERVIRFRWESMVQAAAPSMEAHYRRFHNLYENVIKSATVMPWGEVVQTTLGNPSGSPNTVVDNTLGLYMLLAYSYIEKCKETGVDPEKSTFDAEITAVLYGDDNTFTVAETPTVPFAVSDVIEHSLPLGFTVTTETLEKRPVYQLDFLSKNFVKLSGGLVVFKPKHALKAQSSMRYRGNRAVRFADFSRGCAFRTLTFYDKPRFRMIDQYVLDRMKFYDGMYPNDIEWKRSKGQYLTHVQLIRLFSGVE